MTTYPAWTPAAQPGIIPLHPMTFGQLFGRTFAALRRNPKVLLGFAVGFQVIGIVVTALVIGGLTVLLQTRLETVSPFSAEYREISAGNAVALVVVGIPLGLVVQCITVLVQGIVAAEVAGSAVAERQSLRQLWARVRPAFWRLLGYSLLLSAALVLAAAVVFVPAFLLMSAGNGGVTEMLAGGLALLVLFAGFSVLTLWITTKLVAVVPILVLERARILQAVARSWRLTRGRFWPTFGVLFLQNLIFATVGQVVYSVTAFLGMLLTGLLSPLGAGGPDLVGMIVAVSIGLFAYVLVMATGAVVQATAAAVITIDLRMRAEGLDIDLLGYVERRDAGHTPLPDPYAFDPSRQHAPRPQFAPGPHPQPTYGAGEPQPFPLPSGSAAAHSAPHPQQPYGPAGPQPFPAPQGSPAPPAPHEPAAPYAPAVPPAAPMPQARPERQPDPTPAPWTPPGQGS